jgi:hypothetical protein
MHHYYTYLTPFLGVSRATSGGRNSRRSRIKSTATQHHLDRVT